MPRELHRIRRAAAWIQAAITAALAAALITAALLTPAPAAAAPRPAVTVVFSVVEVKEDVSFTLRTRDFPRRTNFTVLIDRPGKQAEGGLEAGTFFSEGGGELELTYEIPESLRGALILAVRVESADGYLGTGWFINENRLYQSKDPAHKPVLTFSGAQKNASVKVAGQNFPPDTRFMVRAGPHHTFYRDYTFVESVTSAADGTLAFTLALPEKAADAEAVMVRLDGGGTHAYGSYQNSDGGGSVSEQSLYQFEWCKVVMTRPVAALAPGEEFDAVWTVQNTSNIAWADSEPDYVYRYAGGERMHKYEDAHVFQWTVPRAAVFDVAVDMIAPSDFAGWHSTTWAIAKGNQEMCRLKISVFVKDE